MKTENEIRSLLDELKTDRDNALSWAEDFEDETEIKTRYNFAIECLEEIINEPRKLETYYNGETGIMHCANCGGTMFIDVDFESPVFKWFKCVNCGMEFRTNNENKEDDKVYLDYGIVFGD